MALVVDGTAAAAGARAPVVDLNNVANVNLNLVSGAIGNDAATINETEFSNVGAVTVTSGVSGSELSVSNAALSTVHGFAVTGRKFVETIDFATTTGTADVAALSVAGTGVSATSLSTFNVADGDTVEGVTLATSGTNYVTINAGTAATSIKATGSGTNTIVLGTASASKLSVDLSGTTGTNTFDIGTILKNDTSVVGGSGTDTLKVNLTSATQVIPTVSGVETLTLDFDAAATYNASKTTGLTNLNIAGSTANGTVSQLAATADTLGTTSNNTGSVTVQYVTGAKADVVYNIGSSAKAETAVANGSTAFTNINSLTVNAAGSGTSGLGALNVGSAATALTLNTAAAVNDLTVGALTGANLTSIEVNATAGDVTLSTGADVAATKLQTVALTTTGGADLDVLGGQNFTGAAKLTSFTVTAGDESAVTVGGVLAAEALETISLTAGNDASLTSGAFVVHDGVDTSALTSVSVEIGDGATLSLAAAGVFVDGLTAATDLDQVSIVTGGLAAASRIGAIEGNSIGGVTLEVGASTAATTLTIDAFKSDSVGDINVTVGQNSTIAVTELSELADASTGSVGNITAAGKGAFSITASSTTASNYQAVGAVDFSLLEGGGTAVFNDAILTGTTFTGGKGGDVFVGTGGSDVISSGAGNDNVTGGLSADTIDLGTGTDTVNFTTYASVDSVTNFAAGAGADVTGYGLTALNAELAAVIANSTVDNGNGVGVAAADAANFSAVIGVAGITFDAADNIFLTSATNAADVAAYIAGSSFAAGSQDGDGIIVAWVDAAADLHVSMAVVEVTGQLINSAVVSDLAVFTGTYTVAGLATGNFDFIA